MAVKTLSKPGRHADGNNLYLSISSNGGKRWVFFYELRGRQREMGLGSARTVGLQDARKRADAARKSLADGIDPLVAKGRSSGLTFEQCAIRYVQAHKPGWKNARHAAQWDTTLKSYANPAIGSWSIADVDTAAVMSVIEPIWKSKNVTAARLRGRIEQILDWAKVSGYRDGDNPARWRGHLDKLLARRSRVRKVRHHPALPFTLLPAFWRSLVSQDSIAAKSLAFVILTAARTTEATEAVWPEIDPLAKVWTVPGLRMKGGRDHRVPLSVPALAILKDVAPLKDGTGSLIFPGRGVHKPQSENTMLALLKRMKAGKITVHGFRSTFRDWAAETTAYPGDVVEMALAHAIESDTEAAYRRGDMLDIHSRPLTKWPGKRLRNAISSRAFLPVASRPPGLHHRVA
jgi:integrase